MYFILSIFCFSLHAQTAGPLGLKQAVRKAVENNNSIQQQRAKVEQLKHDTSAVRSLLFPKLDFIGSKTTLKNAVGTSGTAAFGGEAYNQYNWDLKLTQPIIGFGSRAAIRASDFGTKIAEIELEMAERDLTRDVIQAFYRVLLNQRLLEILESRQKVVNEALSTAQSRQRTGRGQLLDVLTVKTEIALLKPQIEDAHNQLEAAGAELATYLAEQGKFELRLKGALRGLLLADVQKRMDPKQAHLPELEHVRLEREKLNETRQVTEGKHLPSLNLIGDYGALSYTQSEITAADSNQWSVKFELTVPLFSGLQSVNERRSLAEQDRQLEFKGRETENQLALTQVESLKAVQTTGASLVSSEEASQLAEQAMNEARRNFRLATIDFMTFLTVQKSALDAYNSLDKNKFNNIVALTKYFIATGQPLDTLVDMLEEKK